jgi:hypothetical protein
VQQSERASDAATAPVVIAAAVTAVSSVPAGPSWPHPGLCAHWIPDPPGDGAAFATPVPIPRAASPSEPAMAVPAAILLKFTM